MTAESNYQFLFSGPNYNSREEIWDSNGNDDEVSDASVIFTTGNTRFFYTYLIGIPNYYSYFSEPEAQAGEFISVSKTSDLGKSIEYLLGQSSSYRSGYESFFSDVANIEFTEKIQTSSASNDVGAITFASYQYQNSINDDQDIQAAYIKHGASEGTKDYRQQSDVWMRSDHFSNNTFASNLTLGDELFSNLMHEIGHSLGLTHGINLPSEERNPKYSIIPQLRMMA